MPGSFPSISTTYSSSFGGVTCPCVKYHIDTTLTLARGIPMTELIPLVSVSVWVSPERQDVRKHMHQLFYIYSAFLSHSCIYLTAMSLCFVLSTVPDTGNTKVNKTCLLTWKNFQRQRVIWVHNYNLSQCSSCNRRTESSWRSQRGCHLVGSGFIGCGGWGGDVAGVISRLRNSTHNSDSSEVW
jgi:hypothetical protein